MVAPKQGEVIVISFSPTQGHEQAGERPALVLSGNIYNKTSGLCICVPITKVSKGYPFEVPIQTKKIHGVVLTDHLRTLDHTARTWKRLDRASKETFAKTQALIQKLLF